MSRRNQSLKIKKTVCVWVCPSYTTWFSEKSVNSDSPNSTDELWISSTSADTSRQQIGAKICTKTIYSIPL